MNQPLIFGEGTPESAWDSDALFRRLAATDLETLVPQGRRMVVVSPHPDDEILGAGGMLAQAALLGREILMVAVTDGEASHLGSTAWTPEQLRTTRVIERIEGLQALGIESPQMVRLCIPDGAVKAAHRRLQRALGQVLTANDVVFATWKFDGHPDHDTVGRVTNEVCAAAGITHYQVPVWMWHWARPEDDRIPWDRLQSISLPHIILQQKQRALAAHRSQLAPDATTGRAAILPPTMLERLGRPWEVVIQ